MIERVAAESGADVIRVDGRLLASRIDPRTEARAWLASRRLFLERVRTVIVLGLGAGYHVEELLQHTSARVLVLEPRPEIVAHVPLTFDDARVRIETCANAGAVRANAAVRTAVEQSFVVLVHPASRSLDPDYYRAVQAQLTGRDWGTLTWAWALKGHTALDGNPRVGAEPLTIYDLAQTELVQDSEERERLLVKALRELVK